MRKLLIVTALFSILLLGTVTWWNNGISSVNKDNKTEKVFIIAKGEGVRSVANRLEKEGLIKDPVAFFILVNFVLNIDEKIQAGDHRLSQAMTAEETARSLTLATNDVWITIPEGYRGQEIADVLEKEIRTYKQAWRKTLEENEGYLFPDTYLIPKTAEINQIVSILRNNFNNRFIEIEKNKKPGLDNNEIVKVASLVEREARHNVDRPLVASVIYNRLNIGMKLDIDATVQYVLGYQEDEKRWWKEGLTNEDLTISSPYNTYRNPGLPPAPISNPGIAALSAAANPAQTNYLYYISDKKGVNHYAQTLEEHNANREKYLSD